MRKFLLALLILGVSAATCFGQSSGSGTSRFSIGIDGGLPIGDASNAYTAGAGLSLKYDISVAENTYATISAGYEALFTKSDLQAFGAKSSYGFVPIKVGLKYYFNDGFFGEAQVGATVSTESGGGTAFAYAPGIGYTFTGGFEAGLRFEGWSKDGSVNQFAVRLAYCFH